MMNKKLCIIVPCHNEGSCIAGVIENLRLHQPDAEILVINDASTDDTEAVVNSCDGKNLKILTLPFNLGIGGAVQTGLIYAKEGGFDLAVKFDGDGQHLANEIQLLLEPILEGDAELVIGSRFLTNNRGFKSTFMRRVGIRVFQSLSRVLTGQLITDNTSGFRAYNKRALEFAAENYPAFDYPEPEEVVLFLRNGYKLAEVPVLMAERQGGKSSINALKAVYYMMKVVFSVLMAAVRTKIESR